jgi:hypothetical protein
MADKPVSDAGNFNGVVSHTYEGLTLAVLCSIRDELRRLNALLNCPNFTGIPATLRKIERNTKPAPKAKPERRP